MTDRPTIPPGTPVSEILDAALVPVVKAWDRLALNMLEVISQQQATQRRVGHAVTAVRVAAVCAVAGIIVAAGALWFVLESDRRDRREYRAFDRAATQMALDALGRQVKAQEARLDAAMPCAAPGRP